MARRRLTPSRRLATAARWPLGVLKTGWDYLWRTTPMRRHEAPGTVDDDMPPPLPPGSDTEDLQRVEDGFGPLPSATSSPGACSCTCGRRCSSESSGCPAGPATAS